ncbi:hypothetical protein NE547_05880 [Flavonifractor sp. DFI.6.63]|uniref:Uncharacterized protein n=1 Tax=Lawsonibacter hominis TaxID=2763053 RepID=A0A8J6JCP1_9FIRM|nr:MULTISPECIES: hypothetical protein [Oscillospiraceae]MBS1384802.1 hypothetical protein [Flavonifractor sp.]MDU2196350.1 hypothetical protein [Clostridiales bacterium]MDY2978198.1 hypothetical protein [Oscillospiraceae bacterium]MBC5733418.1 hypothetical protein [Lawsonibacter hominis]MCI6398451.1 hypothetical protein [Lawsonibacter sp.]
MRMKLERWYPLGFPGGAECAWTAAGLGAALLYGWCRFAAPFQRALSALYESGAGRVRVLIPGAVMAPFPTFLSGVFTGFWALALCMPALAVFHYAWHFQGSRSIYRMRRLPQRWELWRRCLAGPLAGALGCLLAAGLTLLLCLLCYWFQTPAACRAADLWAMTGGVS